MPKQLALFVSFDFTSLLFKNMTLGSFFWYQSLITKSNTWSSSYDRCDFNDRTTTLCSFKQNKKDPKFSLKCRKHMISLVFISIKAASRKVIQTLFHLLWPPLITAKDLKGSEDPFGWEITDEPLCLILVWTGYGRWARGNVICYWSQEMCRS